MVYSNPNSNDLFIDRPRGSKKPLTQKQLDYLYEEICKKGRTIKSLSDETGVAVGTISKRVRSNNWTATQNMCAFNQDHIDEIAQDYQKGLSFEELSKKYPISIESLIRLKNRNWKRTTNRKNKYSFDENFFDVIDTEQKAYWLGFMYADGYILSKRKDHKRRNQSQSFGMSLGIQDIDALENLKEDLQADNPINIYEVGQTSFSYGNKVARLLFTSQHTVDQLKEKGCSEQKTFTITFPSENVVPKELVHHFIRGYFDGDGSLSRYDLMNKWNLHFVGTYEFLMGIQEFFHTNVKLDQRWPERNNNNYSLKYCGNQQIKRFMNILYEDAHRFMKRKYDKYLELLNTVKTGV